MGKFNLNAESFLEDQQNIQNNTRKERNQKQQVDKESVTEEVKTEEKSSTNSQMANMLPPVTLKNLTFADVRKRKHAKSFTLDEAVVERLEHLKKLYNTSTSELVNEILKSFLFPEEN